MSRVLYYLVLKPVSMLPFRILYGLSTFLYWTLYRVVGYRRKVVRGNIQRSFPHKNDDERLQIERAFYRHFFDLVVETIKLFSIRKKELFDSCELVNPEIFNPYITAKKRVIITSGHYGNWELASQLLAQRVNMKILGIYTPLSNQFMDRKLCSSRSRFGMQMVNRLDVKALLEKPAVTAEAVLFATDQSPGRSRSAYWTTFLSQETGILFGAERYSTLHGCPVFYTHFEKPRRGHYRFRFELICEDASQTEYGQVTQAHTRSLERDIHAAPHLWLWTHRRWKRTRPDGVPFHPRMSATCIPSA